MKKGLLFLCLFFTFAPLLWAGSFLSHRRGSEESQRVLGGLETKRGFSLGFGQEAEVAQETDALRFTSETLASIGELWSQGEFNRALERLKRLPDTPTEGNEFELKEQKQYYLVVLHAKLGHYERTVNQARQYLAQFSGSPHHAEVYYYFAQGLAMLRQPLEGTRQISPDLLGELPPSQAGPLRDQLIEDALKKGEYSAAFRFLEDEQGRLVPGYERWVSEIVEGLSEPDDISDVLSRYEEHKDLQALAHLRMIRVLVKEQKIEEAKKYLQERLDEKGIEPKFLAELQALEGFIDNNQELVPYRIGVILPLSHPRFGRLAQEVLDGLEVALQKFLLNGQSFELVIKDSGLGKKSKKLGGKQRKKEQEDKVKDLVRELAIEEKVIAILGPLARDTSIAAGAAADKYKLPVLSFSLTENIGEGKGHLFRYQKTPLREARLMAEYAVDYLQAKRFVLFYPAGNAGYAKMKAFRERVEALGGSIAGMARVKAKQVDLRRDFLAMTGGFRPLSPEEQEELALTREQPTSIVDFDAIYAPFKPERLNVISNFAALFDAGKVWILAGHEANTRELRLIDEPDHLLFADSYSGSINNAALRPFNEAHWKMFNFRAHYRAPSNYSLHGYESLELLSRLLLTRENQTREALTQALKEMKNLPVLSGKVTHQGQGELVKDLKVYRFKGRIPRPLF